MNILALDLGSKSGWAYLKDGQLESGVQTFDVKRGESPGMRYLRFNEWMDEVLRHRIYEPSKIVHVLLPKPTLVVYEQTHQRGGAATEVAAGFATRVQEFCARFPTLLEHAAVHSRTLKKWATGKGNCGKPEMIAAARKRYPGIEIIDDNHADALLLLAWAQDEFAALAAGEQR